MSDLVVREQLSSIETNARRRWVELMRPAAELANAIAGTDFVKSAIRHNPGAIAACVLYGDEVGLGPMQALAQISVIDGRPALSAEAMRALILAAGHELWVEESTVAKATIAGKRRDSQQTSRVTWTLDDARRAGLAQRQNWQRYPRAMLTARATSELARLIFADAIGGLVVAEELEDGELAGIDAPAAKSSGQTRKRESTTLNGPTRAAAVPVVSDEPPEPPLPGEPGYDDEAPVDDPSEKAWRLMHKLFREQGLEERDARLAYASTLVGRELSSTRDLSGSEVSQVLDALTAAQTPDATVPTDESRDEPEDAHASAGAPADSAELSPTVALAIFRARVAGEGLSDALIAESARSLGFGGRSLGQLTPYELDALLDDALRRNEPS